MAFKTCFCFYFCKISGNLFYVAIIKMLLLLGIEGRHIPISHIPKKIHNDVKCKILLGNLDPQSDRASMVN